MRTAPAHVPIVKKAPGDVLQRRREPNGPPTTFFRVLPQRALEKRIFFRRVGVGKHPRLKSREILLRKKQMPDHDCMIINMLKKKQKKTRRLPHPLIYCHAARSRRRQRQPAAKPANQGGCQTPRNGDRVRRRWRQRPPGAAHRTGGSGATTSGARQGATVPRVRPDAAQAAAVDASDRPSRRPTSPARGASLRPPRQPAQHPGGHRAAVAANKSPPETPRRHPGAGAWPRARRPLLPLQSLRPPARTTVDRQQRRGQ